MAHEVLTHVRQFCLGQHLCVGLAHRLDREDGGEDVEELVGDDVPGEFQHPVARPQLRAASDVPEELRQAHLADDVVEHEMKLRPGKLVLDLVVGGSVVLVVVGHGGFPSVGGAGKRNVNQISKAERAQRYDSLSKYILA